MSSRVNYEDCLSFIFWIRNLSHASTFREGYSPPSSCARPTPLLHLVFRSRIKTHEEALAPRGTRSLPVGAQNIAVGVREDRLTVGVFWTVVTTRGHGRGSQAAESALPESLGR